LIGPDLRRLAFLYCVIGGCAYFALLPLSNTIPSATAIVASLGCLIIVGLYLQLWIAQKLENRATVWLIIAFLPVLPLSTLIQSGFLGFGTYWALAIVSFLYSQSQRRLLFIIFTPPVLFLAMSIFVSYMAARDDIRRLVWSQQSSFGDRVERVTGDLVDHFQWLDLSNVRQRKSIDGRLNQNLLVGAVVSRLQGGAHDYASGETIFDVAISLIPRALWPDKPTVGGGGNVVTQYTGIRFARGTSVGAGQVLEFYVNFGTWGVIGGYLIYGLLLGYLDALVIMSLRQNNQGGFLLFSMMGISLLQPGGNLVEIASSMAAAAVAAYGVNYLLNRVNATVSTRSV
jgi:hypothetical protein